VQAHPKEIQARAGHSSIQVTFDVYGHLFPGQDEAFAERLSELWWSNGGLKADFASDELKAKRQKVGSDLH
jgi:hypothetical protein